jgi:hypothetical protein
MINGRCACATVRYEVRGEVTEYCHCHCSICRQVHGAAFVSWGQGARDAFKLLSGEDHLKVYSFSDRADSIFCDRCGSTLLVDFKTETEQLYITLGTVDGDVKCPPGFHQFVGSKAPWFEICDALPQHDGWAEPQ